MSGEKCQKSQKQPLQLDEQSLQCNLMRLFDPNILENCKISRLHIDQMEKNYLKWSQLVHTKLKGKGKLSHLPSKGPKLGDPRFEA